LMMYAMQRNGTSRHAAFRTMAVSRLPTSDFLRFPPTNADTARRVKG
jgi:hypothetical protein